MKDSVFSAFASRRSCPGPSFGFSAHHASRSNARTSSWLKCRWRRGLETFVCLVPCDPSVPEAERGQTSLSKAHSAELPHPGYSWTFKLSGSVPRFVPCSPAMASALQPKEKVLLTLTRLLRSKEKLQVHHLFRLSPRQRCPLRGDV